MTDREFIRLCQLGITAANNPREAAENVYDACRIYAVFHNMDPDIECAIRRPGQPRHHSDTNCWSVAFEAGPYEWAVAVSLNHDGNILAEPYYGFDLSFYDGKA